MALALPAWASGLAGATPVGAATQGAGALAQAIGTPTSSGVAGDVSLGGQRTGGVQIGTTAIPKEAIWVALGLAALYVVSVLMRK